MPTHFRAVQAFANLFQNRAERQSVSGTPGVRHLFGHGTAKRTIFYKSCGDPYLGAMIPISVVFWAYFARIDPGPLRARLRPPIQKDRPLAEKLILV
jgi:hypothetical protein